MLKEEVLKLLDEAKEVAGQPFEDLKEKVEALEDPTGTDEVEALKAELAAEKEKTAAVQAAHDEYVVAEDAEDVDQNAKIEAGQKLRDAVKAALEA